MNETYAQGREVVRLLQHLFHNLFAVEENVPENKLAAVLPSEFLGWLTGKLPLLEAERIVAEAQVPLAAWERLCAIIDSDSGGDRLSHLWYLVCLGQRAAPKHKLARVSLNLLLTWDDGTLLPMSAVVTDQMIEEPTFTDAIVATILSRNAATFTEYLFKLGLDGLHKHGTNYRGLTEQDPFEIMVNALQHKLVPQLPPEYRPLVENYVRLVQGLFRPLVPPQALVKKAAAQPVGGWEA